MNKTESRNFNPGKGLIKTGECDTPAYLNGDFVFECADNAMSPGIIRGDMVVISAKAPLKCGDRALIRADGEPSICIACPCGDCIKFISEDAKETHIFYYTPGKKNDVEIIGRAVGIIRKL